MEFTYEYYFAKAMQHNEKQEYEPAIAALFLAVFCKKNHQMTDMLIQYTESVKYDEYKLEQAFRDLVLQAVNEERYTEVYDLFSYVLYEIKTENFTLLDLMSMLKQQDTLDLYKLMEITLSERSNGLKSEAYFIGQFMTENHQLMLSKVQAVFLEVQLLVMRVWFRLESQHQKELVDFFDANNLSVPALAVIMKYSVAYNDCYSVFCTTANLFRSEGKEGIAMLLERYAAFFAVPDQLQFQEDLRIDSKKLENCEVISERLSVRYIQMDKQQSGMKDIAAKYKECNQIAVIICSNNARYQMECMLYLQRQILPKNFQAEVLIVTGAKSMCQGYNEAMKCSNARYKVYMHHDTFLVHRECLLNTVSMLEQNENIGLLGVAGAMGKLEDGIWWNARPENLKYSLFQYVGVGVNVIQTASGLYTVTAMDGVYMAAKHDVEWREDLFTGWHFYDISQCREYEKAGMELKVLCDDKPWIWHKLTITKKYLTEYERNRQIYIDTYQS